MIDLSGLRSIARRVGVDPDRAVRAAEGLAAQRGESIDFTAAALGEQLDAGTDLDAAVSSLREADPTPT